MQRRKFIVMAGAAVALSRPLSALAQPASMPVLGFLSSESQGEFEHLVAAFRAGLESTGYVDGRNVTIDFRFADGQSDLRATFAGELVRRQAAVIVAADNFAAIDARKATATIPIVFATRGEPVSLTLLPYLNRTDGNVTGVAFFPSSLGSKRMGLLRDTAPRAQTMGVLLDPKSPAFGSQQREAQDAARAIGVKPLLLSAGSDREIDAAFARLAQQPAPALLVTASGYFTWRRREQILGQTARRAIPAMYTLRDWVDDGGLISYGPILSDTYRQVGVFAGKILKGARPGDLPIDQSTRFELAINAKTAKTLGIEVPQRLIALADKVVE